MSKYEHHIFIIEYMATFNVAVMFTCMITSCTFGKLSSAIYLGNLHFCNFVFIIFTKFWVHILIGNLARQFGGGVYLKVVTFQVSTLSLSLRQQVCMHAFLFLLVYSLKLFKCQHSRSRFANRLRVLIATPGSFAKRADKEHTLNAAFSTNGPQVLP
jgi:hypothetical protein